MADDRMSEFDIVPTPAWRRIDAADRVRVHGLGPVLMVADHLDAALALGEDLTHTAVKLPQGLQADLAALTQRNDAFMAFAQDVRALELALTSRVLQARKRAVALELPQAQFQLLIRSFVGGTALLADVTMEAGPESLGLRGGFGGGPEALQFLKARGVVERDVRSLDDLALLAVTEAYPVAGLIEVGPLMDMIAAFLDALDTAFDLYGPALAQASDPG